MKEYNHILDNNANIEPIVSMVDGKFFDKLVCSPVSQSIPSIVTGFTETILKGIHRERVEKESRALRWYPGVQQVWCWHSIRLTVSQLIISGDFFQLPPVPDQEKNKKIESTHTFDADSWNDCIGRPITLHQVFRQKDPGKLDEYVCT